MEFKIVMNFSAGLPGYKDETVSPLVGRFFVVIGAGGAGRALAFGAKHKGAKVVVANCTYGMILISVIFVLTFEIVRLQ